MSDRPDSSAAVVIPGRREPCPAPRQLTTLEARAFLAWRRAGLDRNEAAAQLARDLGEDAALRELIAAETIAAITRSRRSSARAFADRAGAVVLPGVRP